MRFALWAIVVLAIVAVAMLAPSISPHNPDKLFSNGLTPSGMPLGPSKEFPLGTDQFGRDELSRLLWGGRPALLISGLASVFSSIVGIVLGTAAGYFGGWVDTVISRFVNILMSFPLTLFAVAIVLIVSPSILNLIVIIAVIYWTYTARLVRAEVLTLREQDFVAAAHALGCSPWRLMVKHLMPNVFDTVLVRAVLTMAQVFLLESGLSYLGVGVQPPTPDWGLMIAQSQNYYGSDPGLVIYPGLAIVITVIAVTQLGESYRALKRRT
ncbi:MAG: peptide ABC transporter permease [Sulfobacillus acidophilus]|uniref:Peptide ABC transporter permease n=1 Tax=Sulfobacillus acidophilus TaxID=53633 RepID=A0A2T2WDL2_9FIRM|nr:MAG: peptide ABC transporter permease [Sulfobacillus acidophilus]